MSCYEMQVEEEKRKIDVRIKALAQSYREMVGQSPEEADETGVNQWRLKFAEKKGAADEIIQSIRQMLDDSVAHADSHAVKWIAAGMPEEGEDYEGVLAYDALREIAKVRTDAIGAMVRELERAEPKLVKGEVANENEMVISSDELGAALGKALGSLKKNR